MLGQQLILYEEEFNQLTHICERLNIDANAKAIFLIDKNGQLISNAGDVAELDTTSLASLTAGNIAATGGLAQVLGEKEFGVLFHEGENLNVHITVVAEKAILVVIFDNKTSLGLVRLRVKKAMTEMTKVFETLAKKAPSGAADSPLSEITDDDIDNLFND
ncbi:MAG: roadblock/LC7 domain-containing protein [Myxococcota bacterium]